MIGKCKSKVRDDETFCLCGKIQDAREDETIVEDSIDSRPSSLIKLAVVKQCLVFRPFKDVNKEKTHTDDLLIFSGKRFERVKLDMNVVPG